MIVSVFGAESMESAGDQFQHQLSLVLAKYDTYERPVVIFEHQWMTYAMLDFILTSPFRASTFEDKWSECSPHQRTISALNTTDDVVIMLSPQLLFSKEAHTFDIIGYAALAASLGRKLYSSDHRVLTTLIKARLSEADDELLNRSHGSV